MAEKGDLVAFARESAKAGLDLYGLLGVDATTTPEDIHRAWRRQGLKYHPDKAGASFDPVLYERFAHARDVLVDVEARGIYDTGRAAAAQQRQKVEKMSVEQRRFKDELEAAERAASAAGAAGTAGGAPFSAPPAAAGSDAAEREHLREAGRRRAAERQRREQEVLDNIRRREDEAAAERIAELERRLSEKEEKARRRAERKAEAAGVPAAATPAAPANDATQEPPDPWRTMLSSTDADSAPAGRVDQRPLYKHTLERLHAAGDAQRLQAGQSRFVAQWDEVSDEHVSKYIKRVPRFGPRTAST